MRRSDREISDYEGLKDILDGCNVCRIGIHDKEGIYIVPLNFGYLYEGSKLVLYFHGATVGRKLDGIRENPEVAFEMDCAHRIIEDEDPCEYGFSFKCLMGNGIAEVLEDVEEKKQALTVLMKHQTGKDFSFDDQAASTVAVIKIESTSFTGKWHR